MFDPDREATQKTEVLSILVPHYGQTLTPDLIMEIADEFHAAMNSGPCAWVFQDSK